MKHKLILFDWGNIVESHTLGYTCYDAWKDLFLACGYKAKEDEVVFQKLFKYKVSLAQTKNDFEVIFNQMSKDFGFNVDFSKFCCLYNQIFDKIDYFQEVADFEHSLKDSCYIGILSDLTVFDKERLDKQVDLSQYDYVFLSFEIGRKKPNRETFEFIQTKLPFEPNDILFIDDRKDNVDGASAIGWQTIQATGLELDKIKQKCKEFLK